MVIRKNNLLEVISSPYYPLTEQGVDEVKAVASFFYDVFLYKYPLVACDSLRATQVIAIDNLRGIPPRL